MQTLPPGSYFGKLIDAGLSEIGQNATPAMVLTFSVTHCAKAGEWSPIDPVNRDVLFYLSENARDFSFNDLRTLGFDGNLDTPVFADELSNPGTELEIAIETYQGKSQEKVKIAKLKRGSNRKPVAADVKRTLAAQYKTAFSATAKPSAPPPARAAAPAASAPPKAAAPAPAAAGNVNDEPPF